MSIIIEDQALPTLKEWAKLLGIKGTSTFRKPQMIELMNKVGADRIEKALRLAGVEGRSASWGQLALSAGAAYIVSAATTYGLKHVVSERRPDGSDRRAFPSGHATMAFAGATALRHEYGHLSPWVSVGGYALAALVAADRVRRDRHYAHDVVAGAAIGAVITELSYLINKRFVRARKTDIVLTSQTVGLTFRF